MSTDISGAGGAGELSASVASLRILLFLYTKYHIKKKRIPNATKRIVNTWMARRLVIEEACYVLATTTAIMTASTPGVILGELLLAGPAEAEGFATSFSRACFGTVGPGVGSGSGVCTASGGGTCASGFSGAITRGAEGGREVVVGAAGRGGALFKKAGPGVTAGAGGNGVDTGWSITGWRIASGVG